MRCTACGYISFDYLDRCQKCSTDLTRERMSLNLPAARPDPISVKTIIDRVAASRAGESRSQEKEKTRIKPPASLEEAMPEIDLTHDPADDPLATLRKQATSINVEGLRRKSDPVEISLDDLEMEQAFKKNPLA